MEVKEKENCNFFFYGTEVELITRNIFPTLGVVVCSPISALGTVVCSPISTLRKSRQMN